MYENKYSNFLTILLVIIIIAIVGCLIFGGYKVYKQYNSTKDANDYVNSFLENNKNDLTNDAMPDDNTDDENTTPDQIEDTPQGNTSSTGGNNYQAYKGFKVAGTIEIPRTKASYPILDEKGTSALETSVCMIYGAGINKQGNTLIIGHNYRDGRFFANNKNIVVGDKIYVTDLNGQRLSYTVYDKFETKMEDASFLTRNTNGAREISLQTCTDDGSLRLIILAKCDLDS